MCLNYLQLVAKIIKYKILMYYRTSRMSRNFQQNLVKLRTTSFVEFVRSYLIFPQNVLLEFMEHINKN